MYIFCIIFQVNNLHANGNYEEAERVSKRTKSLVIAGFIIGFVLAVVIIAVRLMTVQGV